MIQDHNPQLGSSSDAGDATQRRSSDMVLMLRQVLAGAKDWFAGLPHEKHRYVPYNGDLDTPKVDTGKPQ